MRSSQRPGKDTREAAAAAPEPRPPGAGWAEGTESQVHLLEGARLLASSLDLETTLRQVTGFLVPRFADYVRVHLVGEDGSLRQMAAAHVDPEQVSRLEALGRLPGPMASLGYPAAARAWRSRRPVLVPDAADEEARSAPHKPEAVRLSSTLEPCSYALVPLVARGVAIGLLWLATTSTSGRRYRAEDAALGELLELFGARAALALDNARLHTELRQAHERELNTSRLEAQLIQARLEALRAQLNPHFLFNALNTIAMLVRRQANADALRGIVGLSQLLRQVLDRRSTPEIRLGEELALIEHYLTVERLRFRDRLTVEVQVAPEVLDARVPSLLLQPLVENAVRHGIGRRGEAGRIGIVGRREGDNLRLEVRDDGPGFPDDWDPGTSAGVGLANTRERLERLYGEGHRLEAGNGGTGGAVVTVTIPFVTAPAAEAE